MSKKTISKDSHIKKKRGFKYQTLEVLNEILLRNRVYSDILTTLIKKVEGGLRKYFQERGIEGISIEEYGSYFHQTNLPTSDLDFLVGFHFSDNDFLNEEIERIIDILEEEFKPLEIEEWKTFVLASTKCRLINIELKAGLEIEIQFSSNKDSINKRTYYGAVGKRYPVFYEASLIMKFLNKRFVTSRHSYEMKTNFPGGYFYDTQVWKIMVNNEFKEEKDIFSILLKMMQFFACITVNDGFEDLFHYDENTAGFGTISFYFKERESLNHFQKIFEEIRKALVNNTYLKGFSFEKSIKNIHLPTKWNYDLQDTIKILRKGFSVYGEELEKKKKKMIPLPVPSITCCMSCLLEAIENAKDPYNDHSNKYL